MNILHNQGVLIFSTVMASKLVNNKTEQLPYMLA